jgi:DNA processing protein
VTDPVQLPAAELSALLTLAATPGLPDWRALELLQRFGSAEAALQELGRQCGGHAAAAAASLSVRRRVARALHAVEAERIRVLSATSPAYPAVLGATLGPAAPPVLFARGHLDLLRRPCISVVGSRSASDYALDMAEQLGAATARAGGCVVSGLARGVDAAAHRGALDAGGATAAVMGCGVDVYYPHENMRLQDRIAEDGLLLSEFLPGEAPRRYRFPHRNRIIAGLSRAVVVVEAGARSGALLTASHAMERGIATFAVPNAVSEAGMEGILGLFRDGVAPFTGVRDLLESTGLVPLGAPLAQGSASPLQGGAEPASSAGGPGHAGGPVRARVLEAVHRRPAYLDSIAAAAGVAPGAALGILLELELEGLVSQVSGGRFSRLAGRRSC